MRRIRVTGIVREANALRQALSAEMTPAQRDLLARRREQSIRQIDAILAGHRITPRHLPAPSRRAYAFLKQLDLRHVKLVDESESARREPAARPESVSYRGLRAFLDRLLDDIAVTVEAGRFNATATLRVIRRTADRLLHAMERDGLRAEHLTPESRKRVAWFRYFAEAEALDRYARAVQRAQSVLTGLPAARTRWRPPLRVHYRPSSHLYRWRVSDDGTRIILATPMITFDVETLRCLAQQMSGGKRQWPAVTAAMMAEPYQAVAADLEAAVGVGECTRGMAHDLAETFDRVNLASFNGELTRPKLRWTRMPTGRTFGRYDFVNDQVSISSTLDRPDVPPFVVDHVMHHELLHKKHGFRWRGSRQHTHTRSLRAEERAFPRYEQAARFLDKLSAGGSRSP